MGIDRSLPVLVGVGVAGRREDDPAAAAEASTLMEDALRHSIDDSGCPRIARSLDWIGVPEGTWPYRDPGRLLADRVGARGAHTVIADVGITQQELVTRALAAVTSGGAGVAAVVGGEAKFRALRAAITGVQVEDTEQPDTALPDERVTPGSLASVGVNDLEIERNTVSPVVAYALIENALGHAAGRTIDAHRDHIAAMWAAMATVARDNPCAWDRSAPAAEAIREGRAPNRMIAFPYTKAHSAQWNVDQAAALLVCTVGTAIELGIDRSRWVFPHAATVSNHSVAVSERAMIHRCAGAEVAAASVLSLAGLGIDDIAHIDLYSCFPSAVQIYADALGLAHLDDRRPLTVTGGLTFAGGPLNNYVLQAMVELVQRLRGGDRSFALSTSVSGFLVKQGFSVWSTEPPVRFMDDDVSAAVAFRTPTVAVVADASGPGRLTSWTVDHVRGEPARTVAFVELPDGTRTIALSGDRALAEVCMSGDPIGRHVNVDGATFELL